jgi:VanZ family protein
MQQPIEQAMWPAPRVRWLLWLALFAAWTVALLVPLPAQPPGFPTDLPDLKFYFSKGLHISVYALLAAVGSWLLLSRRYRWWFIAILMAHAIATEILQWLLPSGREGCVRDVCIDAAGIALGMALSWNRWRE